MAQLHFSSTAIVTSLSSPCTATATSISVEGTDGFPVSFPYELILGLGTNSEEVVLVTAASGTTFTVERGREGTPAVEHDQGTEVVHGLSSRVPRESQKHIYDATGVHGLAASSNVVGTTDTQTLSGKTLTAPVISDFSNATHDHSGGAAGGPVPQSSVTDLTSRLSGIESNVSDHESRLSTLEEDTGWVNIPLANNLTGHGVVPFQARRIGPTVHLRGQIQSSVGDRFTFTADSHQTATVAFMPSGFRPPGYVVDAAAAGLQAGAFGMIPLATVIEPGNGDVSFRSQTGEENGPLILCLDGISYPAD